MTDCISLHQEFPVRRQAGGVHGHRRRGIPSSRLLQGDVRRRRIRRPSSHSLLGPT